MRFATPAGGLLVLAAVLLAAALQAGCAGGREAGQRPPEARYGHRYEGRTPEEGRVTLAVTAPDSARPYFYYPAPVGAVEVRHAPFAGAAPDTQRVRAEVVVTGSLPDTCLSLHEARQERAGHLINVTLTMRRPHDAGFGCRRLTRPYRFYLPLEGRYGPGHYTLKINDVVHPFVIQAE